MEKMKVIWTKQAVSDLQKAHDYIAAQDPNAVSMVLEQIEKACRTLTMIPQMGRTGRVKGTKELGAMFIMPYRMRKKEVEILAVIPASRRWPDSFSRD
jgi:toxin ParE1/3/4